MKRVRPFGVRKTSGVSPPGVLEHDVNHVVNFGALVRGKLLQFPGKQRIFRIISFADRVGENAIGGNIQRNQNLNQRVEGGQFSPRSIAPI